jgi:hypothetical protein
MIDRDRYLDRGGYCLGAPWIAEVEVLQRRVPLASE